MSWNYRVMRTEFKYPNGDKDELFEIVEAYYPDEEPPNGTPDKYCTATPCGDTLSELRGELERMVLATQLPVLEASDFNEENEYDPER